MTNLNPLGEAVVNYFIDNNMVSTRPQTCGSYTVLPDDNSTMSEDCSKLGWNGTHADGKWSTFHSMSETRILKPIARRFGPWQSDKIGFYTFPARRNCDDHDAGKASLSPGDTWAMFVRWILCFIVAQYFGELHALHIHNNL